MPTFQIWWSCSHVSHVNQNVCFSWQPLGLPNYEAIAFRVALNIVCPFYMARCCKGLTSYKVTNHQNKTSSTLSRIFWAHLSSLPPIFSKVMGNGKGPPGYVPKDGTPYPSPWPKLWPAECLSFQGIRYPAITFGYMMVYVSLGLCQSGNVVPSNPEWFGERGGVAQGLRQTTSASPWPLKSAIAAMKTCEP